MKCIEDFRHFVQGITGIMKKNRILVETSDNDGIWCKKKDISVLKASSGHIGNLNFTCEADFSDLIERSASSSTRWIAWDFRLWPAAVARPEVVYLQ